MKMHFCTLFNSAYLSRGLALHQSLSEQCKAFHLYVFAFDDVCYNYLCELALPNLTVISLQTFEDQALLAIKPGRTATEYCWTCTPSTILFCIEKYNLPHCTYIDADMYFYSDPSVLVEEMGQHDVLITDHRYTSRYDQSAKSGRYCVQFVTFKNNNRGLNVLNWWRQACIEWCYNRFEEGKFGDQKYLDDWTTRFEGVHELKHLGGGVAPWNVQQYRISEQNSQLTGTDIASNQRFRLVFYHYHSLRFFEGDIVCYCDTDYDLSKEVKELLYRPYLKVLMKHYRSVKRKQPAINANGVFGPSAYQPMNFATLWKYYRENIASSRRNILGFRLLRQIRNHYYFFTSEFD